MSPPFTADSTELSPMAAASFREVIRLGGMIRRVMEPYFARHGISGAQWAVLRNLYHAERNGEPSLRLADLGNRLLTRPPSVTNVVERLRVAGFLSRETSATDHRAKQVRLTDAGRELVDRVLVQHARQIEHVMAGLKSDQQATLRDLLDTLNKHLENVAPCECPPADED